MHMYDLQTIIYKHKAEASTDYSAGRSFSFALLPVHPG